MKNRRRTTFTAAVVAVLALGIAGRSRADTRATELDAPAGAVEPADRTPTSTDIAASVVPVSDALTVTTVATPAIGALSPVRVAAGEIRRLPVSILGQAGGSEFCGGIVAAGLVLRYARRRRLM